jgi:hypothetical protein
MENDHPPSVKSDESRPPTLEDLVKLCRALNGASARYLVIGGFAIRAAGFSRNTMDVDLLIDTGTENETQVFAAMMTLPDKAIREVKPGEVGEYGVVRVADEILIDLMKSGCGVDYADAIRDVVWREIDGVRIPFASPETLWRMKQTHREKDILDRLFLRKLLEERGTIVQERLRAPGWLARLFGK